MRDPAIGAHADVVARSAFRRLQLDASAESGAQAESYEEQRDDNNYATTTITSEGGSFVTAKSPVPRLPADDNNEQAGVYQPQLVLSVDHGTNATAHLRRRSMLARCTRPAVAACFVHLQFERAEGFTLAVDAISLSRPVKDLA